MGWLAWSGRARVSLGRALALVVLGLLSVSPARAAETPDRPEVPPDLAPWVPWVLAERGDEPCTPVGSERHCVWPGQLKLDLKSSGGRFELAVFAEVPLAFQLPGDAKSWPTDVTDGTKKLAIIERGGAPFVQLSPGSHSLGGRFDWRRLPETLTIGENAAFVALSLDGHAVPLVKRDGAALWLKGLDPTSGQESEAEQLELDVFRRIEDGIPLVIETRLVLQVSGRAREIEFPTPLLPGTFPLSLSGDLAAAISPNGALRVQLTPGRHELSVRARSRGVPEGLASPERAAPWPAQEIWVFSPRPALRAVEISGAPGIDASRTVLPDDWKQLGAYAVAPGQKLLLQTTRRGEPELPPNRLSLRREFWLDDDASAFTVRDELTGTMHQGWRLDLLEGELGQVRVAGEAQVITVSADGQHRGVELREAELSMQAVSRLPFAGSLSSVGWSTHVDSLSATLHLPPGWDVFATSGVDSVADTWVRRWDLFAVFYVLVLTLATTKLVGRGAGVVAFIALVLSHGVDGAPEYIWLVLIVLAALAALVRVPRLETILKWSFRAAALTLAVVLVTFAGDQVRQALYPHLGQSFNTPGAYSENMEGGSGTVAAPASPALEPAPAPMEAAVDDLKEEARAEKPLLLDRGQNSLAKSKRADAPSSNYGSAPAQKQFQVGAVVQTGPGLPDVVHSTWSFTWTGPVTAENTMKLYLISPTLMRALTALRLLAIGVFAYRLWLYVRRAPGAPASPPTDTAPPDSSSPSSPSTGSASGPAAVVAALLVGLGALVWTSPAQAVEPSAPLLEQLRARLTKPAPCEPNCISVPRAMLRLDSRGLEFRATIHAGRTAAYRLPGPANVLSEVVLELDGRPARDVRLESDGAFYLRTPEGVHELVLEASLEGDHTTLDVGTLPHLVEVISDGWVVSGVNDDGHVEGGTLTLSRQIDAQRKTDGKEANRAQIVVPPWFSVAREISLGVNGSAHTVVVRASDASSPEVLTLPLLPGEQVTTPGVEIRGNVAVLSFPREVTTREFVSTLALTRDPKRRFELKLVAPADAPYTETWSIECGVVWHCLTQGLSTTSHVDRGRSLESYAPWPGESLSLVASEPGAAAGQSLTVDSATLSVTPGPRLAKSRLDQQVRTSRSQIHSVGIPENALLERVELDGQEQATKNEKGLVRISLSPGSHRVSIQWQEDVPATTVFRTSSVDLGAEASNVRTSIAVPDERWLLLAGGAGYGPAILFWGYLLLIVIAGCLLPLVPGNRLKRHEWILLGLGLTQIPAAVAVFIVGWFFLVDSRRYWQHRSDLLKNALQVLLIGATLFFLVALTTAVYQGLVISPDMEVQGADSYAGQLAWYLDRSPRHTPSVWFVSVSIWLWRAVMLAWALWLSRALLVWLRWAWFSAQEAGFWAPSAPRSPRRWSRVIANANPVPPSPEPVPPDDSAAPPAENE